jgi:hypothetical protein
VNPDCRKNPVPEKETRIINEKKAAPQGSPTMKKSFHQ